MEDVAEQLQRGAIAQLRELLEPNAMVAAARTGRLGFEGFDTRGAIAVLLTAHGASEELLDMLAELKTLEDARLRSVFWPMAQWCRDAIR